MAVGTMTPEQKRTHLVLLGLQVFKFTLAIDEGWRLMKPPPQMDVPVMRYVLANRWELSRVTNPHSYVPRQFSDLPDELLDRLDLSLTEQFIGIN